MLEALMFVAAHAVRNTSLRCAILCCSMLYLRYAAAGAAEDEIQVLRPQRVETIVTGNQENAGAGVNAIITSIDINERPLGQVLEYLSTRVSGKNIRVKKDKDAKIPITLKLENVTWRAVLDFIARKYGMIIDESMMAQNIILLDTPEKVSMIFHNADIRDVINTIAIQANANVVIGPEVTGQVSMRLENVPWLDALNIVVRTLDFVAVPEANTIRITKPEKVANQLDIRIFRLSYIAPEGNKYTAVISSEFAKRESGTGGASLLGQSIIDVLKNVMTAQGKITFEKGSNSLIVRDTATALDQMQQIITKLDVPPKQVHVAVKLVQVTDSDEEAIGVKWGAGITFNVTPVSTWASAFPFDVSNGISKSLLGDLSVASAPTRAVNPITHQIVSSTDTYSLRHATESGFSPATIADPAIALGSMGFGSTSALLQLLQTKTTAKVIQAPQLIALENEEATIQIGQLVRYASNVIAQAANGGQIGGFQEAQGSPLKLGFQLLFIAHVTGPENNILMTIVPKTEDFQGFRTFGTLDLPQTSQTIVVTKMMLRNGETGVIGGLRDTNETLAEIKVPIFSDIPVLGRLFRHKDNTKTASNTLVFVTPTIIDFFETDQMKKDLDKIRQDYGKPFTTIGEEEQPAAR